MPLLGSRRRKTDADTVVGPKNTTPGTADHPSVKDPLKKHPMRTKASSPQLRPSSPVDGAPRPGLKRGNSRSWYGSFNSKATAIAQVAKESISVAGGATSESSDTNGRPQHASYMHNSLKRPRKSDPLTAEATRVNATGSNTEIDVLSEDKEKATEKIDSPVQTKKSDEMPRPEAQPTDIPKDGTSDDTQQPKQTPAGSTWFGWWSRPDGYAPSEAEKSKDGSESVKKASEDVDGGTDNAKPTQGDATADGPQTQALRHKPSFVSDVGERTIDTTSRAWFGLWSASQNLRGQEQNTPTIKVQDEADVGAAKAAEPDADKSTAPKDSPATEATGAASDANTKADSTRPSLERPKSSGWAFWSKQTPPGQKGDEDGKHLGELAVADTPSQSHPEAAQFNEGASNPKKGKKKTNAKDLPARNAKTEPGTPVTGQSTPTAKDNKQVKKTLQTENAFATSAKSASSASLPLPEQPKAADDAKLTPALKALKAQQTRPNIIEPRFRDTYPQAHVLTYWETLGYYIGYPLGIGAAGLQSNPHIDISPQKPKIKNAIAIGVHGYFPAPILQKIIGQPTGTSIRFATHAAAAIRSWVEKNQRDTPCEVEQVALEGEGFIADRVSTLWKLLLNWLTHLRSADLILVAAHSQGVPVAIMLVAKLIQLGCLNPNAKIGICAMAGVNLGPFADYKSRFFGGSAAELFEFSNPQSRVSLEYASSMEIVLRHGVKVTYVGSMDDQLVSLESSLFANLTHPHVQRAVFIDGRLHAPDFIARLIAFALKLRNLGISDHGLVRELSAPVAGSIYGGEGHSRIYDDDAVYEQALEFALETSDMDPKIYLKATSGLPQGTPSDSDRRRSSEQRRSQGGIPSTTLIANSIRRGSMSASVQPGIAPFISRYEIPLSGANANPYFLPWAMRGILEEPVVKKDMQGEVQELVRLFDEWKPASKALKDVKFRLEAVKSKL
ncbi:hypothetical protein K461DRAFT_316809 [Myriangium duriaei CBS 260.36]|uniref:YMC020W-like alpha/beta hydrolase domain-containing protein n=1 Tax=Myriangium duriaei CBS 260.36 TaxID=1168546 RepID=A0A9P4JCZ1_9PEZI|nr:hypothetical protein K461DRAFT_316809 [Myriangium duriaei CBS 260.36]